jgi:transposase-like protein
MPKRKPVNSTAPTTLREAITYFADADRAHAFISKLRFPNGLACPRVGCGSANVGTIATRRMIQCRECKKQSSVKVGTIFEDSPLGLDKWLPAMWMLAGDRNGVSSHELGRAIGVTQKTAWFMLHRIRLAMRERSLSPLSGEVEADETFVGGKTRATGFNPATGHHTLKGGPFAGKATVFGMVERKQPGRPRNRVRATVVPNHKASSLMPVLRLNVLPGSVLYTDALRSYRQADGEYIHRFIDHSLRFAEGRVHTNTIENFWSCVKRTLHGTYIAPRAFHLNAYLDESVFRFNNRELPDGARLEEALKGVEGRRVTYAELTETRKLWRLRPGRAARSVVRRAERAENPLPDYPA